MIPPVPTCPMLRGAGWGEAEQGQLLALGPGPSWGGSEAFLRRHPLVQPARSFPARCHGISPCPLFPPLLTPLP